MKRVLNEIRRDLNRARIERKLDRRIGVAVIQHPEIFDGITAAQAKDIADVLDLSPNKFTEILKYARLAEELRALGIIKRGGQKT